MFPAFCELLPTKAGEGWVMEIKVKHEPDSGMLVATADGSRAGKLAYSNRARSGDKPNEWVAFTTNVNSEYEGNGVGSALALALADAARSSGATIDPTCWFVAEWLDRNPEYSDVDSRHPRH
jgi:predicted GNAT family acetyltransferase